MAFTGFPDEAFEFYERLAADNSRTFWLANKAIYERCGPRPDGRADRGARRARAIPHLPPVPRRALREGQDAVQGPHRGAYSESQGGAGLYIQLGAGGMLTGSGYYDMASDQLERFRAAIDAGRHRRRPRPARAHRSNSKGMRLGAMNELKTAPRGFPKDHPRIELLRRKGLFAAQDWPLAKWMHTKQVVSQDHARLEGRRAK